MPYKDIKKQRSYQRNWCKGRKQNKLPVRKRNAEYVKKIKETNPCIDCNNFYPSYVMQFDHIGTDKKAAVAHLTGQNYSLKVIQDEIDKCELVCANCHAIRTHNRKELRKII